MTWQEAAGIAERAIAERTGTAEDTEAALLLARAALDARLHVSPW